MRYIITIIALCFSVYSYADNTLGYAPILSDSGADQVFKPGSPGNAQPVVIDVVLHEKDAILSMLKRAESLAMMPNPADRPRQIALVLHGPEIEHFTISSYSANREIVDLAAKLDAFNVIDIKMCNTAMDQMNINKKEIPAFIEIVPFAPRELKRLNSEGYLNL